MLTHLSLFTGIGGLDLAAEAAGFVTVGQCEWADYPTAVLERHWPDVPRWRDIRTLTGEDFYAKTGLRTVDIISGGFPCQPFSVAGKRRGREDDRFLWPEMLRVISELKPRWIIGENVAGIVSMALDTVLSDLESKGYTAKAVIIPACAVNAPHRRDRVCIIGYSNGGNSTWDARRREQPGLENGVTRSSKPGFCGGDDGIPGELDILADTCCAGLEREFEYKTRSPNFITDSCCHCRERERERDAGWPNTQSGLGGSHDGLSAWMDGVRTAWADGTWESGIPRVIGKTPHRKERLQCLGNAVVPQQFYPVFKTIYDIEMEVSQE